MGGLESIALSPGSLSGQTPESRPAPYGNLRTKLLDFRGFDSSIILILRCGILMSIENLPDFLSQQILVHRENLSRDIGLI